MNPINHAHVVNEINQTNQRNQTNLLRLGAATRDTIWKIQGYGLVLITFLSFFPILFHFEEYLFFTLLTIALAVAWLDGRQIWARTPIDLPLLLFVGWVLMTIPFAIDPAYSFSEWRKLVAQILVFYWAVLVLRAHPDRSVTRGVLTAVVIGTVILCAYALPDFVARGGTWVDRGVRARAPGSDINWLGTYLVIVIPLVAAVGIALQTRWQRLACCGGVLCLSLLTLASTYMRAAWLSVVVQAMAFVLMTGRRRWLMWFLGCCLLGSFGLLALHERGYLQDTMSSLTLNKRLEIWKLAAAEVLEHPYVGIGYGSDTFGKRFAEHFESAQDSFFYKKRPGPFNTFVMVALGSGVPALLFLVWVLVRAFRSLIFGATKVCHRETYALIIGIAIMILGFTVRNFFEYMFAGSLAYLFWILVAVGMAEVNHR